MVIRLLIGSSALQSGIKAAEEVPKGPEVVVMPMP